MRVRRLLAIAGAVLALGCGGDDAADGAGGQPAPGHTAGDGSDDGGAGGTGGRGRAGRPGSGTSGSSGSAGASGGSALAGSGSTGAGRGGSPAGAGGSVQAGAEGSAGGAVVDNSCMNDTDCMLCNVALPPGCCPGCPAPRSKRQCDADLLAFKQRCATTNMNFRPIPVCPAIECFDPGTALCEGGVCVRVEQANR